MILMSLALAVGCQRQAVLSPTPALAATATMVVVAHTVTPTEPAAPSATHTRTATASQTPQPTGTSTVTASYTPQPTETSTATLAWTPTPTATWTHTPIPTPTLMPTATHTPIPLPTPDGVSRAAIVPILMYHYISEPPPGANALRRDLSVSPQAFADQLAYFRRAGYQSITLYDLVMHLRIGWPLPPKSILFTFDDGYKDHYTDALPLLREHGFTGTFFVITGFADEGRPDYLSWEDVVEMSAAGMEMATHSYTHPDLRGQSVDYIVWQTLGPKEAMESRTGVPVTAFCYPFGFYDEQVIAVIRSAHYWSGVTTRQGMLHTWEGLFELERVRVRGGDSVTALVQRIGYLANLAAADSAAAPQPSPTPVPEATPRPTYPADPQ